MEFYSRCPSCAQSGYNHCTYQLRNPDIREVTEVYILEREQPVITRVSPGPTLWDRQCLLCGHEWSD